MKDKLEQFIARKKDELDTNIPDPAVLSRILEQMETGKKLKPKGIVISFRVMQWAAACLILLGCGVALLVWKQQPTETTPNIAQVINRPNPSEKQDDPSVETKPDPSSVSLIVNESAKRNSIDSLDNDLASRKEALKVKMKTQQRVIEKRVAFASLNNMESPASRIIATSRINALKNTGNDVVDALVQTLNQDPSANVRLAALDALGRFYRETYVRSKLVASLKKQQDPIVQIALINLLTRMRESGILSELDKLVGDENTMKAVKDCAYASIFTLRTT